MGFAPDVVGRMSLWQFLACADGWARANDPKASGRTNDVEDFDDVEEILDAAPEMII